MYVWAVVVIVHTLLYVSSHNAVIHYVTKSPDFAICRICVSFIAFWSVFCIARSIIGVNGYLEAIYSCPGVKVTQGHAC